MGAKKHRTGLQALLYRNTGGPNIRPLTSTSSGGRAGGKFQSPRTIAWLLRQWPLDPKAACRIS